MPTLEPLPRRRGDVQLQAVAEDEFIVKDRGTRSYFRVGPVEHFLLSRLDGTHTSETLRREFELKFQQPLSQAELVEFVEMVRGQKLLDEPAAAPAVDTARKPSTDDEDDEDDDRNGQSWLFFRKSLFDPDRLFTWLEPNLGFLWTRTFVVLSALAIVAAGVTLWAHRGDFFLAMPRAARWETLAVVYVTLVLVTTLHEFAHGLTCKRYGGEVHELGVLMIFFMPCFYCDVSDAWLIPQKSRRLWVTLAGGWSDLCVWAASVFLWRLTVPDSLLHYLCSVILSTCGTRVFLNLNPLLRLDGYYLLADWLEIPNLRIRARAYWMGCLRAVLWGAAWPKPVEKPWALVGYGLAMWLFAVMLLDLLAIGTWKFVLGHLGWFGGAVSVALMILISRRVFKGLLQTEMITMLKTRPLRTKIWAALLVGGPIVLFLVPANRLATGNVEVRSGRRVEVHAEVAGFLRSIGVEEGARVDKGETLGRLDVPDLESLVRRKQAEIAECEATLARLKTGARPEQLREERLRVERAAEWVDLARADLERARKGLTQIFVQLDESVSQSQTELAYAQTSLNRAETLYRLGALAGEQLRAERKKVSLLESRLTQAEAGRREREAEGVRQAEAELARREKELADARSSLSLLEAGSRPEEIEAETAKRTRLLEELRYLNQESGRRQVLAPTAGVVCTPRMNEMHGLYFDKGALICTIEEMSSVVAEIAVDEDSIVDVRPEQTVELKIRAFPFETFTARVERIAPAAAPLPGRTQSLVKVLCRVDNREGKLKAGMTGFARIHRGSQSLATLLWTRVLKEIRTEFWW